MHRDSLKSYKNNRLRNQKGQIVVEYVLLLIVAVTVAVLLTQAMVSRSQDDTGFLIDKWDKIIRMIGVDPTDEPTAP